MTPELRSLLNRFDEKDAYEFPKAFAYQELEKRANRVADALKHGGRRIKFEDAVYNQDASFSIAVLLCDFERNIRRGHAIPTIRFSNFGNLVSVTWSELLPAGVFQEAVSLLESNGFTFVPEDQLQEAYDGVMEDRKTFATWWVRYFDWL